MDVNIYWDWLMFLLQNSKVKMHRPLWEHVNVSLLVFHRSGINCDLLTSANLFLILLDIIIVLWEQKYLWSCKSHLTSTTWSMTDSGSRGNGFMFLGRMPRVFLRNAVQILSLLFTAEGKSLHPHFGIFKNINLSLNNLKSLDKQVNPATINK